MILNTTYQNDKKVWYVLPVIIISQFCCTSLWFAGNGVMSDLILTFDLDNSALGHLTSAVQFGFIAGTLVFALFTISDRFSPTKVFFLSAITASLFNVLIIWDSNTIWTLLILRFFTGFFLAGIYPIGMKIAADYFDKGLEKSLGLLVGALVVGTAFPHLLKGITSAVPWKNVLITTSVLALIGGLLMYSFVKDGPFRKASQGLNLSAFFKVFKKSEFRSAAFGYFGHMWELYAFWAFVPLMLLSYQKEHSDIILDIPLLSFGIIAIGGVGCIIGANISQRLGTKKTAFLALLLSGICCLISPWLFSVNLPIIFLIFLFLWGTFVIADSPLFSTLVAQNADAEIKGTALTIVNSIGFAITVISIQIINNLQASYTSNYIYITLAIGPIFGLIFLSRSKKQTD